MPNGKYIHRFADLFRVSWPKNAKKEKNTNIGGLVLSGDFALHLFSDALLMSLLLAGPALVVCLLVGLTVSVFQAVTQISDSSLVSVPKLLAVGAVTVIAGPWALSKLAAYATQILSAIPTYL
jgi:flagellar biosynthetic protein FliQ